MRQAIGTTWIMQLVIIFMLIFVAFLALSINYTKAFRIKNELVTMVEKYEGAKEGEGGSIFLINNYLSHNNYTVMNGCSEGEYGVKNLDTPTLEKAVSGTKYFYCISRINTGNSKLKDRSKYEVKVFFKFNLPVVGDIFTFTVSGTTIDVNEPVDNLEYIPR